MVSFFIVLKNIVFLFYIKKNCTLWHTKEVFQLQFRTNVYINNTQDYYSDLIETRIQNKGKFENSL